MTKRISTTLSIIFICLQTNGQEWKAKWISTMESQSVTNTWLTDRKERQLQNKPASALAMIAVDNKYSSSAHVVKASIKSLG